MTEPTYVYRKGEGWVPGFEERYLVTLKSGERVWIIARHPQVGERHMSKNFKFSPGYGSSLKPNIPKILEHMWETSLQDFPFRTTPTYKDDTYVYITVEKYEP